MPKGIYGDEFNPLHFSPEQLFDVYELDEETECFSGYLETYEYEDIQRLGFDRENYGLVPIQGEGWGDPISLKEAKRRGHEWWEENSPFQLGDI